MAVPVIEGWEKASGGLTGTPGPVDKPTGVATGDLLVFIAHNDSTSSIPQFSDNKTGWNFIFNSGDGHSDSHVGVWWRIADGTEGANESCTSDADQDWVLFYIRISGTVSSPIHKQAANHDTSGTSHAIGGVTTTIDDCLVLYALSSDGADMMPFSVAGTGWVQKDEETVSPGASSAVGATWGARDLATAGASGTATVSGDVSDGTAWFQIALEPGGAADTSDAEAPHLFPFMPPQFLQHEIVGY